MKKILILSYLLIQFSFGTHAQRKAIRGVWVPAPRFTSVLHSYQNIQEFVDLLDSLHFNSIYLVSYSQSQTIYPSQVLQAYTKVQNLAETSLLSPYMKDYDRPLKSPSQDPVADLIRIAHQHQIKVFFWFEYGFMGDIKPITEENLIYAHHPEFLGRANNGQPASYHQKDYYFNAYDPQVQNYLLQLIKEGIQRYPDVDGIQGDDRLPAMPINSGYDPYTVHRYQLSHEGQAPPQDYRDKEWVKWRIDFLNQFAIKLYHQVKAINPHIMVSFAPNPYPWSKENLMQDWPQWVADGVCDLLAVQCYRYSAEAYKSTVEEALTYAKKSNPHQLFASGIILMEGGKAKMTPALLKEQIGINRSLGIQNEIYFYNEALHDEALKNVFKVIYPNKIPFPIPQSIRNLNH